MESESQDRNLPASERKLKKAREDGQVSRSEDLTHLAILGGGTACVFVLAPLFFSYLQHHIAAQLTFDAATVHNTGSMLTRLSSGTALGTAASAVVALFAGMMTVVAALIAGGWVSSTKPLMPDLTRLNPLRGFSNLFTKRRLANTLKMVILVGLICAIAGTFLRAGLAEIATLVLQPTGMAIRSLAHWIFGGVGLMLLAVFGAALIDVPLQGFLHRNEMKMSHQEMKQEGKESEGSPEVKAKIRKKQREMALRNSVNAVPTSDFVVMNPTHFAVAIRYDEKTMGAPQVVSKGADLLALRIRDIAKQHAIPVLQSPMLARALYANAELDRDIPSTLYTAVAQVLAYVYRLKAALRGEGPMPGELPAPAVPPELDPAHKAHLART